MVGGGSGWILQDESQDSLQLIMYYFSLQAFDG